MGTSEAESTSINRTESEMKPPLHFAVYLPLLSVSPREIPPRTLLSFSLSFPLFLCFAYLSFSASPVTSRPLFFFILIGICLGLGDSSTHFFSPSRHPFLSLNKVFCFFFVNERRANEKIFRRGQIGTWDRMIDISDKYKSSGILITKSFPRLDV